MEDVRDLDEQLVADSVPVDVVDLLEVVQVEHHEGDGVVLRRGTPELLPQPVVERAVVVQAGEGVGRRLVLEPCANVRVVERERRGVAEARREEELLLRELDVLADAVDVERALEAAPRDEGDGDQRLRLDRRPGHEANARVEVCLVREDRLAPLDRPAGDPLAVGEALAHHLVRPLAPREDGDQLALRLVRLVDVHVLVGDQVGKRVRDALEQGVEALLGEDVVEDLRESTVRLGGAGRDEAHLRAQRALGRVGRRVGHALGVQKSSSEVRKVRLSALCEDPRS